MAKNTRQELYDRIRQSSKDEVILEEMQRLGFWPENQAIPEGTEELIKRQGELQRELRDLMSKQRLYEDPEQALKEMRKQRMADSKKRQIENKQRHLDEKFEKATEWYKRQQKEILYLGDKVSGGLNQTLFDEDKLKKNNLPIITSASEFADLMGIPLAELRFLSYSRNVSKVSHYQRFYIAKKTGGERLISAPMPRLKRAQYWILDNILEKLELHDCAHGFRRQRSIVTNAKPHVGSYMVINCDFKDFFPTFKYARIKGLFSSFGYSNQIASILALLCSEPDTQKVELDNEIFYVGEGERNLPQGAPTSPSITNIICRRLDKRLQGMAKSIGFTYTRYADDLTFSADRENGKKLGKLKFRLQQILNDEGVILHPDKTRVMRNNNKQEVTGIVVNDKLSIDRKTLKRFRATLFQIEKDGPENKKWGNTSNVLSAIKGYANYVFMVDPEKGKILLARVEKIYKLYGKKPTFTHPTELSAKNLRTQSAKGKAARENWWTPKEKTQPVAEKLPENKIPKIKREENNRRSTADIVDDAQRGIPKANGLIKMIFKSMWFVIKSFFWIALFTFFIIKLATTSGPLTTIFVIAAVYFVLSLFSKR